MHFWGKGGMYGVNLGQSQLRLLDEGDSVKY